MGAGPESGTGDGGTDEVADRRQLPDRRVGGGPGIDWSGEDRRNPWFDRRDPERADRRAQRPEMTGVLTTLRETEFAGGRLRFGHGDRQTTIATTGVPGPAGLRNTLARVSGKAPSVGEITTSERSYEQTVNGENADARGELAWLGNRPGLPTDAVRAGLIGARISAPERADMLQRLSGDHQTAAIRMLTRNCLARLATVVNDRGIHPALASRELDDIDLAVAGAVQAGFSTELLANAGWDGPAPESVDGWRDLLRAVQGTLGSADRAGQVPADSATPDRSTEAAERQRLRAEVRLAESGLAVKAPGAEWAEVHTERTNEPLSARNIFVPLQRGTHDPRLNFPATGGDLHEACQALDTDLAGQTAEAAMLPENVAHAGMLSSYLSADDHAAALTALTAPDQAAALQFLARNITGRLGAALRPGTPWMVAARELDSIDAALAGAERAGLREQLYQHWDPSGPADARPDGWRGPLATILDSEPAPESRDAAACLPQLAAVTVTNDGIRLMRRNATTRVTVRDAGGELSWQNEEWPAADPAHTESATHWATAAAQAEQRLERCIQNEAEIIAGKGWPSLEAVRLSIVPPSRISGVAQAITDAAAHWSILITHRGADREQRQAAAANIDRWLSGAAECDTKAIAVAAEHARGATLQGFAARPPAARVIGPTITELISGTTAHAPITNWRDALSAFTERARIA